MIKVDNIPYTQSIIDTNKTNNNNDKKWIKPLIGSSIGVATGYLATRKINIKQNHHILDELIHLLAMAGGANVGGVLATSFNTDTKKIKRKWHEAGFQMMNTTIPMLMVAGSNALCNKFARKNDILRIISSGIAMSSGAVIATKITNGTKAPNEKHRKYTLKDTLANVDDIVATIAIGFPKLNYLHLETTLMPFIYAYNGMRSGKKE